MAPKLMLCNCAGSQTLDRDGIAQATGLDCSKVHSGLCTHQLTDLAKALEAGGDVIVACGQEVPVFDALADEMDLPAPLSVDIRDRAGWSADTSDKTPKIAALLADAQRPRPAAKTYDVTSHGTCLILGRDATAIDTARQVSGVLTVTLLLPDADDAVVPPVRDVDVIVGQLRSVRGALGKFEVVIDGFRAIEPGGRGPLGRAAPRDGAASACDLILDISGNPPAVPAWEKREGYVRADPGDPLAVARAAFEASHMVGTFEKPLYVTYQDSLCAHSRAGQTACTRCLDLCPTGAITSAGDGVAIDPDICAGCGACASACPSGAVAYDDPPAGDVFGRLHTMAEAYRGNGGVRPRLLVHDGDFGVEMIALAARHGDGLPADVVPMAVDQLGTFGHAEMLVALGVGFARVDILAAPRTDRDQLAAQVDLAVAIAGRPAVRVLDVADPDAMSAALFAEADAMMPQITPILALGARREAARLAARTLRPEGEDLIALPAGAPYGAVLVDTEACTLCLACASLCPPGALADDPDSPKLTFKEDACLQCGLCASVCPEDAITLEPRMNLSDAALSEQVLNEEEPYACIECGKLFGVKSTIERIVEKLEGQHAMFTNSDNARLIRMCDDCRVTAQYHSEAQPFAAGPRPKVRTTDDYKS